MEKVTNELDLNDAQKSKLELVRKEVLAARQEIRADRDQTRNEVLAMLEQPQLDRQKVLAMVEQKTSSINQQAPQVVNALGDFYDSLSTEQRKTLHDHVAEMGERHHHHW